MDLTNALRLCVPRKPELAREFIPEMYIRTVNAATGLANQAGGRARRAGRRFRCSG